MTHSVEILRRIPKDKEVLLVVTELFPCAESFQGKNSVTTHCHFFTARYDEFPDPAPFQWCVQKEHVEFKVGDKIKVKAGIYVDTKKRQSVSFIEKVHDVDKKESRIHAPVKNDTNSGERHVPINFSNPAVMGSLWSIAMGHSIQYYKDRKDATEEKVLAFAQRLHEDYHQIML